MASTGVRSYHAARVLAKELPDALVTLAVPNASDIPTPQENMRITRCASQWQGVREMLRHDIIISRNFPPHLLPLWGEKLLALDFYAAFAIEWMEISRRIPDIRRRAVWNQSNKHYLNLQLALADFVFCSNERQRDVWIGNLSMLGLIPPSVYNADVTLRKLVDVVPYGVQPGKPETNRVALKGVVPGIQKTDKVIIWNGSIMEWFDAETVIRAMAIVRGKRPDAKLFFMGTEHPDFVSSVLLSPPRRALELSEELGLINQTVFFNVGWVPYGEIGDYLAEADIGVCASFDHLEERYSFRTRFVDLFWGEIPIVCTQGDVLAERVERDPLGVAVRSGDVEGFAAGILKLLDDEPYYRRCQANLSKVKEEFAWENTLAPLINFCREGRAISASKRARLRKAIPLAARYAATHVRQLRMRD
jgi:glycosyltransferase involved in cell wall biosynthesis